MNLAMVTAAQWHGEFIAHLAAEGWALREAHVVGVRGLPATDQARLLGNEPDVIAVADPPRLREGKHALVDGFGAPLPNRPDGIARRRPASDAAASLPAQPIAASVLAQSASVVNAASRAANASSTRWASAVTSLFFSARQRCAHVAASSLEPSSLSSARSRSRSCADASAPSVGAAEFEWT